MYDEVLAKRPELESELTLEDFIHLIFEFGVLNFNIKIDLVRLIEIKSYFDMDSTKEEIILKYLDMVLDVEENEEE